jgi:hypothetical protein
LESFLFVAASYMRPKIGTTTDGCLQENVGGGDFGKMTMIIRAKLFIDDAATKRTCDVRLSAIARFAI